MKLFSVIPQALGKTSSPTFTGLTLSSLTAGRVLFAGTGGLIDDDAACLWDNVNKRFGVGATPLYTFHITDNTVGTNTPIAYFTGSEGNIRFLSDNDNTRMQLNILHNAAPSRPTFTTGVLGETYSRFAFSDSSLLWGVGSTDHDTNLYRDSANVLKTDDDFSVGGDFLHMTKAVGRIRFEGTHGGGNEGILYEDSGGTGRFGLLFPGSNIVALGNRAANGVVQIRANVAVGAGGEVTSAIFEDDVIQLLPNGGNVGINEPAPETLTEWTHAQPYLTLHNSTHEDSDGGRESRLNFKGEQSGGEETTLARQEIGHDGTGDDQKGYWDLFINDGNDGDLPTKMIRVDSSTMTVKVNDKIGYTSIGGQAIKLTNKTGANTVVGQTVKADTATDDGVILTAADDVECLGVFLDSGIADAAEAWIVIAGIADVAMEDNTAATHGNWVQTSETEAGYADSTDASPQAAPQHFNEIGHCIESVAAGGGGTHILARCVLHFN